MSLGWQLVYSVLGAVSLGHELDQTAKGKYRVEDNNTKKCRQSFQHRPDLQLKKRLVRFTEDTSSMLSVVTRNSLVIIHNHQGR